MKYSYAVFPSTQSTSIGNIKSTSGNTQGHYRDEVFVCKSDVGPGRALLPAFVKEDTQPIAEIPIQKIVNSKDGNTNSKDGNTNSKDRNTNSKDGNTNLRKSDRIYL